MMFVSNYVSYFLLRAFLQSCQPAETTPIATAAHPKTSVLGVRQTTRATPYQTHFPKTAEV